MADTTLCARVVNECPTTAPQVQENWNILQQLLECICDLGGSSTLIQQGRNVTVTGTGTVADPYIINGCCTTENGDGTYTVTLPDGSTFVIDPRTALQQGNNVVITGAGTVADPYIVNSCCIADNGDGTYTVTLADNSSYTIDTRRPIQEGNNITISGAGTNASPYVISGCCVADNGDDTYTVTLADNSTFTIDTRRPVQQGTNVTITGAGTNADPYIINANTCLNQNASTTLIEETYRGYFNQVVGQDTFTVDTGLTSLALADVKFVDFNFNGAVQPNTDLMANATMPLGGDYSSISVNAGVVSINTRLAIGEANENDYAIMTVIVNRTLSDIAGC